MSKITVDFADITGRIKPMHSVNNGPVEQRAHSRANFGDYAAARFPMARTHDASFIPAYGGSHTVDIIAIFPDFSADENDPASYDFDLTDEYMENILKSGTKVFYRLGNRIEHESKKYGAVPPADPAKWARICEHIIRHMNFGWANGHEYGIEYWEIWNEPDVRPQCWTGTDEQFFELYDIASRHLKACFPGLKIGGPAFCSSTNVALLERFLEYMTRDPSSPAPLDFLSYHHYGRDPYDYSRDAVNYRETLDRFGYSGSEMILNEWNYVRNWTVDELLYSYYTIIGLKGSAYVASSVIEAQRSPINHFMYYDASFGVKWNGLFDNYSQKPLKSYYSMTAFRDLYDLGAEAASFSDDPSVHVCAAVSDDKTEAAVMLSYYKDLESTDGTGTEGEAAVLDLNWSGFSSDSGIDAEYYIIDSSNDLGKVSYETFKGQECGHVMPLPMYTTVLVKLKKR